MAFDASAGEKAPGGGYASARDGTVGSSAQALVVRARMHCGASQ